MIKISKNFETKAKLDTETALEKICEMANLAIENENIFDDVCRDCHFTNEELDSIMYGTVSDMSLNEYYRLQAYLNNVLKNVPPTQQDECDDKCGKCMVQSCDECCGCMNNECENDECICKSYNNNVKNDDSKFIDKINEKLPDNSKINKKEALEAKKYFNEDLQKKVANDYDKAAKEANLELFGTESDLNSMAIGDLKYLLYKNGWQNEFDLSLINHRQTVLSFLYHKLEERITEKIHKKNNIRKEDIENINKKITTNTIEDELFGLDFSDLLSKIFK